MADKLSSMAVGEGKAWLCKCLQIQYRLKGSYHPLARRFSRLSRRDSRLARSLKN